MDKLKTFFKNENINSVLDIGTGSGQFVQVITETISFTNLIGIDPGKEWLQEAKEKFHQSNIKFIQMGAEQLDFPDNSFDMVSMSKALHHLPHLEESFEEIKRVLKPNGWFVIAEMFSDNLNKAEENQKLLHHTKSKIDRILGNYHHETWKKNEILEILENNGFKVASHFEQKYPENKIQSPQDIDLWAEKMTTEVEKLKGMPEYKTYHLLIDEFKERLSQDGLQSPTNIIAICKQIS